MHEGAPTTIAPPAAPVRQCIPDDRGCGRKRNRIGRRDGRGGRTRRRGRILKGIALALSLLVLATAAAGWFYYEHLNDNIRKGERSSGKGGAEKAPPNAAGQTPLNVLLLGSDSRASQKNLDLGGGHGDRDRKPLADVQMLLSISADRSHASLVSVPRDTRVQIPECTDPDTGQVYPPVSAIINESLARGGAGCTLATWERLTDIYIDHWMMVDFAGVVSMADAVGGVEVCVKENIWDRDLTTGKGGSGLKLEAGRHWIKGKTALQWLRTRYAFGSDINRTRAQQMYLNSMVRALRSQKTFTDSGRLMKLAEAGTKALSVDEGLGSVRKLYDLAMEFKGVPSKRITTTTMPSEPDPRYPNARLIPKPGEAQRLFTMMREDIPFDSGGSERPKPDSVDGPAPSPKANIPVTVLNGTGVDGQPPISGRAGVVADALTDSGFTRATTVGDLSPQERTSVRYLEDQGERGRADALAVARVLGLPKSAVSEASKTGTAGEAAPAAGITVVVGADWPAGADFGAGEAKGGAVPDSANPLNGNDKKACMEVYDPFVW